MRQLIMTVYRILRACFVTNIALTGLLFLVSCAGTEQTSEKKNENVMAEKPKAKYEQLAQEKYSGDLLYIPNQENTFMLCMSNNKPTNENPFPSFSFFIYDLKTDEIIYEDTHENGNVNWKNNDQIMIHTFPGQMKSETDAPIIYIYDIKKKKKFIDEIIKDK